MATPNNHEEMLGAVLARLNDLYEQRFYDSLDVDTLRNEFSLSRQEFRSALAPLYAHGWIEDEIQSAANYFTVRLTVGGKERYDKQTGNTANERIRQQLLVHLARIYEKDPDAMTDSEVLAKELGLERNSVCLNLLIMQRHGLVDLEEKHGVGHALYSVWLTPEGKVAHDNPEPDLIFLSHAAADEEIATCLKRVIERCFSHVKVFVSSDPEDISGGDPWVEKVLANLKSAQVLLILATERGLNRKWVWFETGAAWSQDRLFIPCCLGKKRKGELPPPFWGYQAFNLDEQGDFLNLMKKLQKQFGPTKNEPEIPEILAEITRLNDRAEERERMRATTHATEHAAITQNILDSLTPPDKDLLRLLLHYGQCDDRFLTKHMQAEKSAVAVLLGDLINVGLVACGQQSGISTYRIKLEFVDDLKALLLSQAQNG